MNDFSSAKDGLDQSNEQPKNKDLNPLEKEGLMLLARKGQAPKGEAEGNIVRRNVDEVRKVIECEDGRTRTEIPYKDKDGNVVGHFIEEKGLLPSSNRVYDKFIDGVKGEEAAQTKADLQKLLESRYHIKFSTADDPGYGEDRPARPPTMKELEAIDKALKRTVPASFMLGKGPLLKFVFVDGANLPDKASAHQGRNIYVTSGSYRGKWLHNDAEVYDHKVAYSFEAEMVHELAHNYAKHIYRGKYDRLTKKEESIDPELVKAFGFEKIGKDWFLKGKDGAYYLRTRNGWVSHDQQGREKIGTPISDEDMQKKALVELPTTYNHNPSETIAELYSCLFLGGASREHFLKTNASLYKRIKNDDQIKGIDTYLLTRRQRCGSYVRGLHGRLILNTAENLRVINEFEKRAGSN